MAKVVDRFIKYVKIDTQSESGSKTFPSTSKQLDFGKKLVEELNKIGLKDVSMDKYGYVFGTIPSTIEGKVPTIGFLAHIDTTPEMTGENVNPQFIENYDGTEIVLNKERNIVMSPKKFPDLKQYIGKTLITTDGTTLLGADDKAGVAAIVTAAEYLIKHPEIPHGTIRVGFTPDEEIGRGTDYFNIDKFDADFAYTLDGGPIGEITYETFNAANAEVTVKGKGVHPGAAKNKMLNSLIVVNELISLLPASERPEHTEEREGYYHLETLTGDVNKSFAKFLIRDHNREKFEERKEFFRKAVDFLNEKYGKNTIELKLDDLYYNMGDKLRSCMDIVKLAKKSMEDVGIKPYVYPMRGGTDGARLTYMGLPTPNLFTGGHNCHGRYEYIPTFVLEKAVKVIIKIVENVATNNWQQ